jgi:hypothetical protein
MDQSVQMKKARESQTARQTEGETMRNEMGILNLIEQHRKTVLSTPFLLALVLGFVYALGGNEFRRVIDFFAPGHIFGH